MNFFRSQRNPLHLRITTHAEVLEFPVDPKLRVREVFEKVCNAVSVRETWFFGLAAEFGDELVWLKSDKELRQEVKVKISKDNPDQIIPLQFLVKYYPENVLEELVLPVTQGLFYLQLRDDIMSGKLVASPELSILLASYVVQAELGDIDEFDDIPDSPGLPSRAIDQMKKLEPLIPSYIMENSKTEMTIDHWFEEVYNQYKKHKGLTSEESKIEYIHKTADNADNFGVTYFKVKLGKDVETAIPHYIGITATGINLYALEDKLEPYRSWPWVEVDDLNYKSRCFYIWPSHLKREDRKPEEVTFFSDSSSANQIILELCQTNHDLYMQRRREDSIEVQQMKEAAREEKDRRQSERNSLLREREARRLADQDLNDAQEQMRYLKNLEKNQINEINRQFKKIEMLNEKVKIQEEEKTLLQIQVSQKDIVIEDMSDEMKHLRKENHDLREKLDYYEQLNTHRKISNGEIRNQSPYGYSELSPNMEQSNIMFGMVNSGNDYATNAGYTENEASSQEKLHLALQMVSQLNRESDRLNTEIPDQQKRFEETFTKIRNGLGDLKADNDDY